MHPAPLKSQTALFDTHHPVSGDFDSRLKLISISFSFKLLMALTDIIFEN